MRTHGINMEAVNVIFVSSVDCKLSKTELLRGIVTEKLTTAAREIFAVVERTVSGYEEEAAGLRQEIDRQRIQLEAILQPRVSLCRIGGEDSGSRAGLDHAEEEDEEEEKEEEPEKMRGRKSSSINLTVCLLEDSTISVLKRGVSQSQVKEVMCPPGLQEADFLDLLRASFPQLTGQFDAFTVDAHRSLTPLTVKTLTPEEIRRSIKSTGRGRSALYIRVQAAQETPRGQEEERPPSSAMKDDGVHDTRPHAQSLKDPAGEESERSRDSRQKQQVEKEEDGEQCGTSEDFSALSSARSAADSNHEEDDNEAEEEEEEEWKPDKEEKEEKVDSSEITKRKRVKDSGVKSKRRKQIKSSVKVASDSSGVPVSCKVCRALSGSENMLIKHSWSHVEDPERLCGVCGEQSETPEELRTHLESHKKTFSCDVCGKNFLSVVGFQRHAVLHTGEKPYECDVCLKKYASKNTLRNHRLVHVEEKPHRCDVCDKTFAFKQQLRTHAVSHTGEKPYTCDLCGKSVLDLISLSRHKMSHSGKKRYSCPVCGKKFLTPAAVRGHEKIHTVRDKTFLCDVCCKTFHSQSILSVHLKTHGGKKTVCSICGKGLSSKGALSRHLLVHSGRETLQVLRVWTHV
uniref:C2H2-type domain-containing protein n=1 Tax=Labrus bergylta TaxID=56723 RepID=A0A3Q3FHC6_9LABR